MWQMLSETVYTASPARNPTIGYLDVLRSATRQDCVDFYQSRYVPNNQVFVVVGDVKTDEVTQTHASRPLYAGYGSMASKAYSPVRELNVT